MIIYIKKEITNKIDLDIIINEYSFWKITWHNFVDSVSLIYIVYL